MTGDTLQTAQLQHAFSRIAALEAQLATAQRERDEARRLAQWTPITPENLPKIGPYETGSWFGTDVVFDVAHCVGTASCEDLLRDGWTHFRPIAPPEVKP